MKTFDIYLIHICVFISRELVEMSCPEIELSCPEVEMSPFLDSFSNINRNVTFCGDSVHMFVVQNIRLYYIL